MEMAIPRLQKAISLRERSSGTRCITECNTAPLWKAPCYLFLLPSLEVTGLNKRETQAHADIIPSLIFIFYPLPSRSQSDVGTGACALRVSCRVLLGLPGLRRSQDRSQGREAQPSSWDLFLPPQSSPSPGRSWREQNSSGILYALECLL